jgi:hypothetical protein
MTWLALGALALLLVFALLRAFARAPVARVRKALVTGAAVLGGALILGFLLTGRGAQALWWAVLFGPALYRAYQSWRLKRVFAGRPGGGEASSVETRWLTMRLDHASGTMAGEVRGGRFAGRALAELATAECRALLAELAQNDPDGVPLIEAWLDRADPNWREAEPPPAAGPMGRAEALEVLGLREGAGEAEIRAAHRRLMQAAHPDRGGSDWLASRLNEARDALLGRGRAPGG